MEPSICHRRGCSARHRSNAHSCDCTIHSDSLVASRNAFRSPAARFGILRPASILLSHRLDRIERPLRVQMRPRSPRGIRHRRKRGSRFRWKSGCHRRPRHPASPASKSTWCRCSRWPRISPRCRPAHASLIPTSPAVAKAAVAAGADGLAVGMAAEGRGATSTPGRRRETLVAPSQVETHRRRSRAADRRRRRETETRPRPRRCGRRG
jgi:hypothetical protein